MCKPTGSQKIWSIGLVHSSRQIGRNVKYLKNLPQIYQTTPGQNQLSVPFPAHFPVANRSCILVFCHSVSRLFVINSALVSSVSNHQPDIIFLTSFFPLKIILQSTTLSLIRDTHSRQNQLVSQLISKVISKIRYMHFLFPWVLQVPKFDSTLIIHLKAVFIY